MFKYIALHSILLLIYTVSNAQITELENLYLSSLAESFNGKEIHHNADNYFWSKCLGKDESLTNNELHTEINALLKETTTKKEFYQRINYYLSSELSYYPDLLRISKFVTNKKNGLDKDGYESYSGVAKVSLSVLGRTGGSIFYKYIHDQGEYLSLAELCVPTSNNDGQDTSEVKIFDIERFTPESKDGDTEWVKKGLYNIIYPKMEMDNDIQGSVLVRFVICVDGRVSNVTATTSISPGIDTEAKRVIKLLPPFKPYYQQGKPVMVYFSLPIVFRLQ